MTVFVMARFERTIVCVCVLFLSSILYSHSYISTTFAVSEIAYLYQQGVVQTPSECWKPQIVLNPKT